MSSPKTIKIYGKSYNLKNLSDDLDPQELAGFVDQKMQELSKTAVKTSTVDLAILTALNIACELFELKKNLEENHQAITAKTEDLVRRMETEIDRLQLPSSSP